MIASSLNCVDLLLNAGADPNQPTFRGRTALLHACWNSRDLTLIRGLLDLGASPNYQGTLDGDFALGIAACRDNAPLIQLLLDYGAQIDMCDYDGDTALMAAIHRRYDDCVLQLLVSGADHAIVNDEGYTTLHAVGRFGGLRTIEILKGYKLQGLDPNKLDKQGNTASDLAYQRTTMPDGFLESFRELLSRVQAKDVAESYAEEAAKADTSDCEGIARDFLDAREDFGMD